MRDAIDAAAIGTCNSQPTRRHAPEIQVLFAAKCFMIEFFILRLILWICLPIALGVLAIGPARVKRECRKLWQWISDKRQPPETILANVVKQHQQHLAQNRKSLQQAEATEKEIRNNLEHSQLSLELLNAERQKLDARGDHLAANAAKYKQTLEQSAVETFTKQLEKQRELIIEAQRRLFETELQLRQYEVGRNILLSQLAAAKNVEQQYAIVDQFDPFNALSDWRKAETMIHERLLRASAVEHVREDLSRLMKDPAERPFDAKIIDLPAASPDQSGDEQPRRRETQ